MVHTAISPVSCAGEGERSAAAQHAVLLAPLGGILVGAEVRQALASAWGALAVLLPSLQPAVQLLADLDALSSDQVLAPCCGAALHDHCELSAGCVSGSATGLRPPCELQCVCCYNSTPSSAVILICPAGG